MFYNMIFSMLDFSAMIFYLASNTFIGTFFAGLSLFLIGREFILDNFLAGKSLDIKMQILEKIKKTRAVYVEVEILHNRMVRTLNNLNPSPEKIHEMIRSEVDKIAKKLHEELPFLIASLEIDVYFYYKDNIEIADSLKKYINSVNGILEKVSNGYLRKGEKNITLNENIEISFDELQIAEKVLVDFVKKEKILLEYWNEKF